MSLVCSFLSIIVFIPWCHGIPLLQDAPKVLSCMWEALLDRFSLIQNADTCNNMQSRFRLFALRRHRHAFGFRFLPRVQSGEATCSESFVNCFYLKFPRPLGCTAAAMLPSKQRELSENILQNLWNKLPPQTVEMWTGKLVVPELLPKCPTFEFPCANFRFGRETRRASR